MYEILDLADVDLPAALGEFSTCIQQWCPTMLEESFLVWKTDLLQQSTRGGDPKNALLGLCLWLVTRRTCHHQDHVTRSELYRAMKQIIGLFQSGPDVGLEVIQIGMLVAVYEVCHGLQAQAFQTSASSVALLRMLELDAKTRSPNMMESIDCLKASMLMLDRCVDPDNLSALNI